MLVHEKQIADREVATELTEATAAEILKQTVVERTFIYPRCAEGNEKNLEVLSKSFLYL